MQSIRETIRSLAEKSFTAAVPMLLDLARPQIREQFLKTLILTTMEIEAKADGKSICYPTETAGSTPPPGKFDAELPEGLGAMAGALAVGLCVTVSESAIPAEFDRILTQLAARQDIDGLLFAYTAELGEGDQNALEQMVAQAAPRPVYLWGPDEIRNLFDRQWSEIESRFPTLAQLSIRAGLQTPKADWKVLSVEQLERLTGIYRREGIVLVLGAGVSANMNIPDWEQLLSALYTALITQQLGELVDEKKLFPSISDQQVHPLAEAARKIGEGESPLLSARYLRKGFSDAQSFQKVLSAALYKHSVNGQKSPPLLKELAKLCMPRRTGPRVRSVITYNFDDLLESVLEEEGICHRSLYFGGQQALEDELPIFHPHGFLPKDAHRYDRLEDSMLTFSEEAYHRVFRDPYHWANTVQLQAFQQNSCLLVGLSLTDPNLRRLLEFGRTGGESPRHFAFMKRTSLDELMRHSPKGDDGKPQVHPASARAFLDLHHRLQEGVLAELDLEVIWFESYDEMPKAVKMIRA
ncbi:SIR2 family protein [Streptomyces sp. NPDC048723]|uniref:SIR2 family protein n=1 Tax=Streptomyces sp. NPDC048723 TaxID=3365589 RepID=UPI0037157692